MCNYVDILADAAHLEHDFLVLLVAVDNLLNDIDPLFLLHLRVRLQDELRVIPGYVDLELDVVDPLCKRAPAMCSKKEEEEEKLTL